MRRSRRTGLAAPRHPNWEVIPARTLRPPLPNPGFVLPLLLLVALAGCGDPVNDSTPATDAGVAELAGPSSRAVDVSFDSDDAVALSPDGTGDTTSDDLAGDVGLLDTADLGEDAEVEPEPPLELFAVAPESGTTDGGTDLLLVGLGFTAAVEVFLGGEPCLEVDVVDESKLLCRSPANPAGLYDVKVVVPLARATLEGGFRYVAPVRIESLEPGRGSSDGGTPLVLRGSGLSPETQVSIGGRLAIGVEWVRDGELRLLTPPGEPGPRRVQVSDRAGLDVLEDGFVYEAPFRLTAVVPGVVPASGGAHVAIEGSGFGAADDITARFGLLEAEIVDVAGERLGVIAPPGPANDKVDVTVLSAGRGAQTLVGGVGYYDSSIPTPALLSVWPSSGSTAGRERIILSGIGLAGVERVGLGGADAPILETASTWIAVETPAGEVGWVDVVVDTGGEDLALADAFEYREPVLIDVVEPSAGDAGGGEPVIVRGARFDEGVTVWFGPLRATELDRIGPGAIRCRTPIGAAGPVEVRVVNPDGRGARAQGVFTYTTAPLLHGFSPAHGSLAGGTWVVVRGAGFVEPVRVLFDGVEAPEVSLLDASTLGVRTPPGRDARYVDVSVKWADGSVLDAVDRFLYFDPLSRTGGVWGDAIVGAVNVTIVAEFGLPLEDAYVRLDVRGAAEYSGLTDANGQVTLSGPDLSGAQTVAATRPGFGSATYVGVDAENVTLELDCAHDGACGVDADCRAALTCVEGLCLHPGCVGEGGIPPARPLGVITGQLSGLDKVGDPAPGEIYLGGVWTTQPGPYSVGGVLADRENTVVDGDGPYTLSSRTGELALVAVCGFYDAETRRFRPMRMGVRRGLFIVGDETYEVDIECDIWLDQTLTIKAVGSPFVEGGPDNYVHYAYLDLGSEGFFGGLVVHRGTDDVLAMTGFAPLEGELADARYYVRGGAFTGRSWPTSISYRPGVTALGAPITLPEFVATPLLRQPDPAGDAPILTGGYLEWVADAGAGPDFWSMTIRDYSGNTWWRLVLPGEYRWANLPQWPEGVEAGLFPAGSMFLYLRGVDAITFDMDDFDNNDFRSSNWNAYSLSGYPIQNP